MSSPARRWGSSPLGVIVDAVADGRVVVGVSATLAGLQALRYAADRARERGCMLLAVRAFRASGTGMGLREVGRQAAFSDVLSAFDEALGGTPTQVLTMVAVRQGAPGPVLVAEASRENDLLIIGGCGVRRIGRMRRASTARHCAIHATCPITIVPLSPFARTGSTNRLARAFAADVDRLLLPLVPPTRPDDG